MFGHTPFQFTGNGRAARLASEEDARRTKTRPSTTQPATPMAPRKESPVPGTASGQSLADWARDLKR